MKFINIRELSTGTSLMTDRLDEATIQPREMAVRFPQVEGLGPGGDLGKAGRAAIVPFQGLPMRGGPGSAIDPGLSDLLVVFALHLHRNRQPLHASGCLDSIPVAPIASGVLHVVVEDELVHGGDQIEVAFPRDVVRLQDGYFLHRPGLPVLWIRYVRLGGSAGGIRGPCPPAPEGFYPLKGIDSRTGLDLSEWSGTPAYKFRKCWAPYDCIGSKIES